MAIIFGGIAIAIVKSPRFQGTLEYKPLKEWTFQDHKWVTFNKTGIAHHPDCPCKKLTAAPPQKESRHGSEREND